MSQAMRIPADRLHALLRSAALLRQTGAVVAAALVALAAVLAATLVAVLVDGSFALSVPALIVADAALLGVVLLGLGRLAVAAWRERYRARRVAVELESRLGLPDNRLVAAVDLAEASQQGASDALRRRAVDLGNSAAVAVSPAAAVDRSGLAQGLKWAALAIVVLAVAYVAYPRLFHAVLPRLLQPTADHPPFTLLEFDVTVEPERAIVGKPALIAVAVDGPVLPEEATLVWLDGEAAERIPLLRVAPPPDASPEASARHFILRLDRVERTRPFHVETPEGRSRRYTLEALPLPLFERVRVRYDYPAYTGWQPSEGPLPITGVRALVGTTVTLTAESNLPLDGGTLSTFAGESDVGTPHAFTPDPSEATRASAAFVVEESGRLEAVLRHGEHASPEPLAVKIEAVADAPPRISIAAPPPTVLAPEGWTIDVAVETSDDVAVDRVLLHRAVNGWAPTPVELRTSGDGRRKTAAARFDLAALGAKAGDVITYFAEARDNHPSSQVSQTDVQVIQVISQAEYEEYARTQYQIDDMEAEWARFQERLDALQARREHVLNELAVLQEQLAAGESLTAEEQRRAEQLRAELEAYRQEALDLYEDMQRRADQAALYDFEQAYQDQLERFGQELQAQASEAAAMDRAVADAMRSPSLGAMERLAQQAERFEQRDAPFNDGMRQERQQLAEDLERVRLADEMVAAAGRLQRVVEGQRDLAERMQQFRHAERLTPGQQQLADRLAQEQADLREEMTAACEALSDASQRAQELLPNMSGGAKRLADAVEQLDVGGDQAAAERQAQGGQGDGAARSAMAAAEKLDSLVQEAGNMAGQASDSLDGCLNLTRQGWQQAMQQMAQARGIPGLGQQGGQGSGYLGSMARMAVVGPATPQGGEGPGRSADPRLTERGGRGVAGDEDGFGDAESITAAASTERTRGVTALTGVPQPYREAAEAYFQRLAEDERYNTTAPGGER